MSEARDDILGRLKRRLGREVLDSERASALETEILRHERRLIPARADVSGEDCVRLFEEMAGASRSADIELTMLMGAHGPLSLHVIIIENG